MQRSYSHDSEDDMNLLPRTFLIPALIIVAVFTALTACSEKSRGLHAGTETELAEIKRNCLEGMRETRSLHGSSYSEDDIRLADRLLTDFSAGLGRIDRRNRTAFEASVKTTVIGLNRLNSKCGSRLIETSEREMICDYIIRTAILKGFIAEYEDITEKWREW